MKTLTELSGTIIRQAAAAAEEARRSLPRQESPVPAQEPATPEPTAAPQDAGAAQGEGEVAAAPAEAPPAGEAAAEAAPAAAPGNAANEAIEAAISKATGISGDRLTMLRGAVEAVGRRTADVRLVRVFGADEQLSGATKDGDYQYVVDLFPQNMRQVAAPREERGGRGGRGRGGGGGGRGGGSGGGKGAASTTGGFSMDSLRDDRKGGRGGPGGRRPGGGGGRGGPPSGGGPKR